MFFDLRIIHPSLAAMFEIARSNNPAEFTSSSRISTRLPGSSQDYEYQLRDPALWRARFNEPIFTLADRSAASIGVSFAENSFETAVAASGDESCLFVVAMPSKGSLTLLLDGAATTASKGSGLVMRPSSRSRALFSDAGARANVTFKVAEVEATLPARARPRLAPAARIHARAGLDLRTGREFKRQLDAVLLEFQRPDGVADNPVALAATTDLLITLLLRAAPHNYTDQLDTGRPCAIRPMCGAARSSCAPTPLCRSALPRSPSRPDAACAT